MTSSVQSESILGLFNKLCELHLGPEQQCHLVQPKIQRRVSFQHLRRRAFSTLFNFLLSPESKQTSNEKTGARPGVGKVLQYIFNLRTARRFDDADCLEHLIETLLAEPTDAKMAVLHLLVMLSDTGTTESPPLLGHDLYRVAVLDSLKSERVCLPEGPLCYGDTKLTAGPTNQTWGTYFHFPRHLFEVEHLRSQVDNSLEAKTFSIFEMTPGTGLSNASLFSAESTEYQDSYELSTRLSLFGGLVSARSSSLDARLELPDLPQDSLPEIIVPKIRSPSEISEDEGFVTTEVSSSDASPAESWMEVDLWEEAMTTIPSQHYVWERIGCEPMATEKHYLTEAGPQVIDEFTRLQKFNEHLMDPGGICPSLRVVSLSQLVKDTINLLIGVPSLCFPYSQESGNFTICPGLFMHGISPEALHSFLGDFVSCGTMHQNLMAFSAPQKIDSFYIGGLVLQAFAGAVRAVLQHYRAAVLAVPKDVTLFALRVHCHKVMQQITFLSNLCQCADKGYNPAGASFPVGVPLITYLYEQSLASLNTDHYLLMLLLLRTTCQPFTLFVQDWVFHGTFRDIYSEFMIQMNMDFLEARDETYWEKGYTLLETGDTSPMPPFLSHLAPKIFRSGKALNLLRMCDPKHFLCRVNDSEIPRLCIWYLRDDLDSVERQCQVYGSRMQEMASQVSMTRAEQRRRANVAKKELLETARRMAANEISRLEGVLDERRKKGDAKKQLELQRLKDQMNADIQRRADEVTEEKARDRVYMARLMHDEDALTREEIRLEEQARDELIKYYTQLGEEATRREQRALWHIQRARLELARREFLEEDQKRWQSEMEDHRQAQSVLTKDAAQLPGWADGDGSTVNIVTNQWGVQGKVLERDWSLPTWAARDVTPKSVSENASAVDVVVDIDVGPEGGSERLEQAPGTHMQDEAAIVSGVLVSGETVAGDSLMQPVSQKTHSSEGMNEPVLESALSTGHCMEEQPAIENKESVDKQSLCMEEAGQQPVSGNSHLQDFAKHPSPRRLKTQVHMVSGASISQETEEKVSRPQIHLSDHMQANMETAELQEARLQVKLVEGQCASKETETPEETRHIRVLGAVSAVTESEEQTLRCQVRQVVGKHVSAQSQGEASTIPRIRHYSAVNIATETQAAEWKVKKPSLFGHVTQLSNSHYTFHAPRLKRQLGKQAMEADSRDFAIKPQVRLHKTRFATAESSEKVERPQIRVSKEAHVSKETEQVDIDSLRRKRFLELNVHGHSSDSTVERLLYGERLPGATSTDYQDTTQLVPAFTLQDLDFRRDDMEHFKDSFDHLNRAPMLDLLDGVPGILQGVGSYSDGERRSEEKDIEVACFTPLSLLLKQALTTPLSVQVSLVDDAVVNYFMVEQNIDKHFEALHNFLFMADGEFAQNLTDILLEKLSCSQLPREVLSPVFLNSVLTKSLQLSCSGNQHSAEALSFSLRYMPEIFRTTAHDTLDCLELRYKVTWPVNVILTEASMECCGRIFSFKLQLRRVAWMLKDCWHKLKRDAIVKKAKDSSQFRQLQLHRQEMQHFVRVMQGYMANQIILVTWQELQQSLDRDVHSLDDLRRVHSEYLHKALFRCLLNKKAAPIMKIIQDIFCLILKFCSQLATSSWERELATGDVIHPNFSAMVTSYKAFKEYFVFLFKVVSKLAARGYQPHLQELLLRLNFNDYYSA